MKIRRIDFYPDDYMAGTFGVLSLAEQGAYWMTCSLLYATGEETMPLGEIEKRIVSATGDHWRRVRTALDGLIGKGKLVVTAAAGGSQEDRKVGVKRVARELQRAHSRHAEAKHAAGERWKNKPQADARASAAALPTASSHQPASNNQQPSGLHAVSNQIDPRAAAVIEDFDHALAAAFGAGAVRPFPAQTDIVLASRWLQAGADPRWFRSFFDERCRVLAARGAGPPRSLNYFAQAVPEAIAQGRAKLPLGDTRRKPTLNEIAG